MSTVLSHTHSSLSGDVLLVWTADDQAAALKEGWFLDENDGAWQIDRDQLPGRPSGAFYRRLWGTVRASATAGSVLHIKAMAFDALAAADAWCLRLAEATGEEPAEDDGCPKGDPDCLGGNGDCHDACSTFAEREDK